jgi:hypothetical protein
MAESLRRAETILPYSIGEKFTQGLGGKFQAHKIFERRAFTELEMEGVEKAPSIILTDGTAHANQQRAQCGVEGSEKRNPY